MVKDAGSIQSHAMYPAIFILVLLGAFTKSAQFPFHFWLPNAMVAPTPISAYLHSATMVKAGVYLLAVMLPVLGGTLAWHITLCSIGGITLLLAGLSGLQQSDLKRILAATTLAVLGLLVLLLGIGTEEAVLAAMLFLLGHALYKATLFMVAGAVDHGTGTRDVGALGGLARLMPWTAGAALLAGCSKMGLPPFFGFVGKEYVYKASTAWVFDELITLVLIIGNALIFVLAFKVAIMPFWRSSQGELPKKPHEAPIAMLLGPILLSALGIIIGVYPALSEPLISTAQDASLGYVSNIHVELWHGINLPLILSVVTVSLGVLLIFLNKKAASFLARIKLPSMEQVYYALLDSTLKLAAWQTRLLQSGLLRNYLLIIILASALLVSSKLWRFGGIELPVVNGSASIQVWAVGIFMFIAVFAAIMSGKRLTALISLGVVGYGVAFLFAHFSAPDLAITQILVETLTVALFAWVVLRLPELSKKDSSRHRYFDAAVSVCCGLLITVLVLKSMALDLAPSISTTLAEWSLEKGHGANVVNVILVDFRALDTLGEITVLAIAAIGVWSLLYRGIRNKKEGGDS
jgi:multicomponent Na+:H+ antiporter subunit A